MHSHSPIQPIDLKATGLRVIWNSIGIILSYRKRAIAVRFFC